jgi:hypothetical protein
MAYRLGPIALCALALFIAVPVPVAANPASSGMESKALAQALDHLDLAIAEARTASGSAFKAFAALGIKTYDPVTVRVKSAREVLYEMSEHFAAMRDDTTKAEIAQAMLGPGWAALMPYLNKGPAGVKELEDRGQGAR